MKKVLVVLLILAVAGGVFAQDLTWSGTVETGIHINKQDGADDVLVWADNDDGVYGVRAKLQAAITGDNWGFKVGYKVETSDAIYRSAAQLYNGYGWLDLLNKMINVKAGLIDDDVWTTKGDEDWGIATGLGVRLEVAPIEGLNVGFFLTWPDDTAGVNASATGSAAIGQFFQETAIGFSYTADAFYVSGGVKLDSDGDTAGAAATDVDEDMRAIFGFGYTGLPALTAKIEANLEHLGNGDERDVWLNETIAYQVMDPLLVGAVLTEKLNNTAGNADDLYLKIKPYVEYKLNDTMTVGAAIPVELQDGLNEIGVNPWFKYAASDTASFKIGYTAHIIPEDTDKLRESALNHDIQATFVWSF